jgi:hypothetical protein
MTFAQWLATSKRGSRFSYYRGFMLMNYHPVTGKPIDDEVHRHGFEAWRAHENRLAMLVQHKHGFGDYEYMAVKL